MSFVLHDNTEYKTYPETKASSREVNLKFSFATAFFTGGIAIPSFAIFDLFSRVCGGVMKVISYKTHGTEMNANFGEVC